MSCGCARAIERAIDDNYDGQRLSDDAAVSILSEYGFDRVNWVLANTIREKDHDGRISRANKEWAKAYFVPQDTTQFQFVVNSHPGLTNLFVNDVHRAWKELGLFDKSHCTGIGEDYASSG